MKLATALAVLIACAAAPAAAHADSISYIKAGNVYLTTPDGSRTHQVTTAGGYSYASQADDGRIVALHGHRFHLMDRWGSVLADFSPVASGTAGTITLSGPFDPVISPDGSKIAYGFYVQYTHGNPSCGLPGGCWEGHLYAGTGYSPSTGPVEWTDPAFAPNYGWMDPAWIDNGHTLMSGPSSAYLEHTGVDTLGDDQHEAAQWFSDFTNNVSNLFDAELNRPGTGVAAIGNSQGDSLRIYRVTGAPVQGNDPEGCLAAPSRGSAYESPSWSPDGGRLTWSDASGLYVADIPDLAAGCPDAGRIKVVTIAPGASRPDWGPADLPDPSTRPVPPAPHLAQPAPVPAPVPAPAPVKPRFAAVAGKGLAVKVSVPSAGTLSARAAKGKRRVATAAARQVKPGTLTLKLKRTKAGRRIHGRVKVTVRFVAAGARARTLTLRLKA